MTQISFKSHKIDTTGWQRLDIVQNAVAIVLDISFQPAGCLPNIETNSKKKKRKKRKEKSCPQRRGSTRSVISCFILRYQNLLPTFKWQKYQMFHITSWSCWTFWLEYSFHLSPMLLISFLWPVPSVVFLDTLWPTKKKKASNYWWGRHVRKRTWKMYSPMDDKQWEK